jgi:ATP-dependent Clp protease protease subunit
MRAGRLQSALQLSQPCSVGPPVLARRPARPARRVRPSAGNWKVFGPTTDYSDGDAEFYRVTSRLADQHEWFAPREPDTQAPEEGQGEGDELEFGLTQRQIAGLGLSSTRSSLPDPVSSDGSAMQGARMRLHPA